MDVNDYFTDFFEQDDISPEERDKLLKSKTGMNSEELDSLSIADKQILTTTLLTELDQKRLEMEDQIVSSLLAICTRSNPELEPILKPVIQASIKRYAVACSQYGYINGQYSILRTAFDKLQKES